MISSQKKHRRISPMPVVSSFPPPNRVTMHSEVTTYTLTPEELAAVIEKYGPPSRPMGSYSSIVTPPTRQKGGGHAGKIRDQGKANGRGKNDSKGEVERQSSAKVSGL
ncbi:hypothetical protein NYE59_01605 [Paenibacillus sp. FSL L8-0323]|uniref:hypothetical protein n=1 Tax=Paenibacillus sp. FSL L8-0323 TaxID=2975330 RepID=UPI0030F9711E